MQRMIGTLCAAVLACSGAKAAEIHVSHFGQVMGSVPWIVALERDMFRRNGVDVTDVISSQGGGTTLRNMLAGGIAFADAAAGATVAGIRAGLPVKVVGTAVNNAADNAWVVLANSPIRSMKDVVGRKFGTTNPGGVTRVFGEMLLKHHGIEPSQVTQVPLGVGAGIAAIDSGAVDATYVLEPLFSKFGSKYRKIARRVGRVAESVATAADHVAGAHRQGTGQAARHPAHAQAGGGLHLRRSQGSDPIAMKRMVNMDEASLSRAVEAMVKARYFSDGRFDPEALDGTRKLLEATGDIKGDVRFREHHRSGVSSRNRNARQYAQPLAPSARHSRRVRRQRSKSFAGPAWSSRPTSCRRP